MLARVAERMYWLGRQVERAENTSRLALVYANLMLDLPRPTRLGWAALVTITGSEDLYFESHAHADERGGVRFLLADPGYPGSIVAACALARENARTSRVIMPREAWEQINDLNLFVAEHARESTARRERADFLTSVIRRSQLISGLLAGTMSHDAAYDFVRLGQNLERADMTTRILDVGSAELLVEERAELAPHENIMWMSVLKSLSAFQMYRRHVRNRVSGEDVVEFLLRNAEFPRSISFCLDELDGGVTRLPRGESCRRSIAGLRRRVVRAQVPELLAGGLHEFMDELQLGLAGTHDRVAGSWFGANGST